MASQGQQALLAAAEERAKVEELSPSHGIENDPVVQQGRAKFKLCVEDMLLDYKHNSAVGIESCANTLIKIFSNVLENPTEEKYRRVKATSNAFKNSISGVKGGEPLMTLAGWKTEVVDMQKFWVFDGTPGTHKYAIMEEACKVLQKSITLIHEKAERKRHEVELKAAAEKERLEKIRLALEEDKQERKLRSEWQAHAHNNQKADTMVSASRGEGL